MTSVRGRKLSYIMQQAISLGLVVCSQLIRLDPCLQSIDRVFGSAPNDSATESELTRSTVHRGQAQARMGGPFIRSQFELSSQRQNNSVTESENTIEWGNTGRQRRGRATPWSSHSSELSSQRQRLIH